MHLLVHLTDADLHPHQVRYWRHALAEEHNLQALGRPSPDLPPVPGYALRRDWELPWKIRCVHRILDNGSSHIAQVTRQWVAAQEGLIRFYFTPAHASWLNQAELALSAFSRRYLRDRVSESRPDLITHIYRSLGEYNAVYAPNLGDGALGSEPSSLRTNLRQIQ